MIFATDYKEGDSEELKFLINIANLKETLIVFRGEVMGQITKFTKRNDMDLIAMVTHQRYFLSKIFNRSHAQQLAFNLEIPLLALHQNVD